MSHDDNYRYNDDTDLSEDDFDYDNDEGVSDGDTELSEDDFSDMSDSDATQLIPAQNGNVIPAVADTASVMPVAADGSIGLAPNAPQSFSRAGMHEKEGRKKKRLIITLVSIVGALAIIYVGMAIFFMYHFSPRTTINDVDCSFKNVENVESIVENQVNDYQISIVERDGKTETLRGSDVDLTYVRDSKVSDILHSQNPWAWPASLFKDQNGSVLHATVTYSKDKLKTTVDKLACMNTANMIAPVNAYAKFDATSLTYVAMPEVEGTTINTDAIYTAIGDAVTDTKEKVDLDAAGCYVNPEVTSTTQSLLDQITLYNKYCAFSITYTFGDKTELLDGTTAINWYTANGDGTLTFDEDALVSWLADFGKRHDTVGTERSFKSTDGQTYTVSGGTYGWEVDEEAELSAIEDAMANHTAETRDPIWVSTAESFTEPEWGTSYIELNLTNQHMYLVQNGQVTFESDVVTGLPTPAKETPAGVWSILEMQSPSVLVGEIQADGQPEYRTTVQYWMRVTWAGVGFHDATWQSSFGGDAYTYRGSHGCINMPYDAAGTLYSMIWVGIPVIIHY